MKLKVSGKQLFRFFVQIFFFIVFPGLFILTYDAIKESYLMIVNGSFNFNELFPRIIEALAIIPVTIVFGRFFCGWLCAFGSLNDFIYNLSKKLFKVNFKVNKTADKYLKLIKYGVLLFGLVFLWNSKGNFLNSLSPWEAFGQLKEFPGMLSAYTTSFIVLLVIMIGAVFIERFFCRYLCPLGAVFTIVSKFSFFRISKPTHSCSKCSLCASKCSMGIELTKMEKVKSGECIYCLKCMDACPRKNPQMTAVRETINPVIAGTVAISALMGTYGLNNLVAQGIGNKNNISIVSDNNNSSDSNGLFSIIQGNVPNADENTSSYQQGTTPSTSEKTTNNNSLQKYKDGTYTGVGRGYMPGLQVQVTVKNSKIASVEIVSSNETPRFAQMPFEIIPQKIVSSQSVSVDAVSGATRTSEGIMMAVEDALSQAVVSQG